MAATILGTSKPVFGVTVQTGMILRTVSDAYTTEKKIIVNEAGEKGGIVLYGDQRQITLEALVPASSPFSTRMAASFTLSQGTTDFYRSAAGAGFGDIILTDASQTTSNEAEQTFSLTFWSSPFFDFAA
jgi:hypothetical protein